MPKTSRSKKRKRKLFLKRLTFLAVCFLIVIGTGFAIKQLVPTQWEAKTFVEEKPKITTQSFSMIAVGDALIHDGVYKDASTGKKGTDGYTIYDFSSMFTDIKPIIQDYDLRFYNQETIIGGKKIGLSTYPCFNSPDEIGLNLLQIGFNTVNLATNHTLDRGEKAILYSRQFWRNQKGIYTFGSYDSFEDRDKVIIKEKNGISYTILGYTTSTNGIKVPGGKEYLVNVYDKEKVKKDIEKVRDKVDVLMVSMHWGTEYTHTPTKAQKEIAEYLSSLGVDIIIGHHPHVVEPIEYVNDTLVIYSLGNFISAQEGVNKRVGMIAGFTVEKTTFGEEKTIKIKDIKADLLWTYHQRYKNFKVIPFTKLNNSLLNNYQSIYEEYKQKINVKKDERIQVGFLK